MRQSDILFCILKPCSCSRGQTLQFFQSSAIVGHGDGQSLMWHHWHHHSLSNSRYGRIAKIILKAWTAQNVQLFPAGRSWVALTWFDVWPDLWKLYTSWLLVLPPFLIDLTFGSCFVWPCLISFAGFRTSIDFVGQSSPFPAASVVGLPTIGWCFSQDSGKMEQVVKELHGSKVGDGDVVEDWIWTGGWNSSSFHRGDDSCFLTHSQILRDVVDIVPILWLDMLVDPNEKWTWSIPSPSLPSFSWLFLGLLPQECTWFTDVFNQFLREMARMYYSLKVGAFFEGMRPELQDHQCCCPEEGRGPCSIFLALAAQDKMLNPLCSVMLLIALRITSCQWTRFGQGLLAEKLSRTVFEPPTPGTVRKLERNEKRKKLENCSMTCAAGNDGCFNKIEDSQHHRIPDISLKNGIWRFFGVKTHPQGIGHVGFCWCLTWWFLCSSVLPALAGEGTNLWPAIWLLNGDDMGWPYDPSIHQPMGKPDGPTIWFHHDQKTNDLP